jgi:hypothetical protein
MSILWSFTIPMEDVRLKMKSCDITDEMLWVLARLAAGRMPSWRGFVVCWKDNLLSNSGVVLLFSVLTSCHRLEVLKLNLSLNCITDIPHPSLFPASRTAGKRPPSLQHLTGLRQFVLKADSDLMGVHTLHLGPRRLPAGLLRYRLSVAYGMVSGVTSMHLPQHLRHLSIHRTTAQLFSHGTLGNEP